MGEEVRQDPILTSGTAGASEAQRWWQCPLCKTYVDALFVEKGIPRIKAIGRLKCPACGCRNLDTVEGEFFDPRLPKEKGEQVQPMDSELARSMQEAGAVQDEVGLYPTDSGVDNEPIWPRMLTQVIIGASLYLGQKMDELISAVDECSPTGGRNRKSNMRGRANELASAIRKGPGPEGK